MTDDTLPPKKPNTLRNWLPRLWAWLVEHKDYTIPVAVFLLGVLAGKLL